jgi:hypothetical protein
MRNSTIDRILAATLAPSICPTSPLQGVDHLFVKHSRGKGGKTAHKHSGVAAQRRQARKLRNRKNNR